MAQLPSFLVIGASKSGTSSIHEYLRQNPLVSLPKRKESHFFICDQATKPAPEVYEGRVLMNPVRNLHEYMADFEEKETATFFGEVCPSYLTYPNAPENIKHYVPDVKLICIIRNPVDRLYSNFVFSKVENSLELFIKLVDSLPSRIPDNPDFYRWFQGGMYFEQLSRYYAIFPEENIKIFLYEELVNSPGQLMSDLSQFANLPAFSYDTSLKFNRSGKVKFKWLKRFIKKSHIVPFLRNTLPVSLYQKMRFHGERILFQKKDGIPPGTRHHLMELYKPDILKLQDLIHRDLSSWMN